MLMSKSRLEKFLYALYSLDSSDLPTPLSRIEELYKCLVTGEEPPTFEPLSRVEKYLMAILGGYDVDSLPNPLSRVEVLLYKLAIGDDNLDDVKSFLSEHEELLAEIIRNGINIEYVLYTLSTEFNTLYNTAEKPVKSAILSGQTLVNLVKNPSDKKIVGKSNGTNARYEYLYQLDTTKTYTLQFVVSDFNGSTSFSCSINNGNQHIYDFKINGNGTYKVLTQSASGPSTELWFYWSIDAWSDENTAKVSNIVFIEGDYTNVDIPYFEGMQSVKMPVLTTTGKNLFDVSKSIYHANGNIVGETVTNQHYFHSILTKQNGGSSNRKDITKLIKLDKGHYFFSGNIIKGNLMLYAYDLNGQYISQSIYLNKGITFTQDVYIDILVPNPVEFDISNIQLEKRAEPSPFEPYKSNILTVNEKVELRGIGEVKDELNLITGELTQRVGTLYLANEYDGIDFDLSKGSTVFINLGVKADEIEYSPILSNTFETKNVFDLDEEGILYDGWGLYARVLKSRITELTNDSMVQYLKAIQSMVFYRKKVESVKTVDLSAVNQDGNNTKLSTFNDITHVTLSSEGLIPEAELEVATKNEEDLEDSSVYTVHTLSEEFNTLYNTAEKPVKSAILKGSTLTNLAKTTSHNFSQGRTPAYDLLQPLKISTTYTVVINVVSLDASELRLRFGKNKDEYLTYKTITEKGLHKFTMTPSVDFNHFSPFIQSSDFDNGLFAEYNDLMIIEGDYTNADIPYFEGMRSVKMPVLTTTGKNLFPTNNFIECGTDDIMVGQDTFEVYLKSGDYCGSYTHADDSDKNTMLRYKLLDEQDNQVLGNGVVNRTFTIENNGLYKLKFGRGSAYNGMFTKIKVQLEEGSVATEYEPYKSNILTVDGEYGSVGGIEDIVDLTTGKATIKTRQTTVTSENVKYNWSNDTHTCFYISQNDMIKGYGETVKSNLFPSGGINVVGSKELVTSDGAKNIIFSILNARLSSTDLTGVIKFLEANELNVRYLLATESIKTVDLSVVDQDGNDTKLKTFNDITHVALSSEGLIPEAELEVAEKVPEVAASMLTISREQEVINTTTNEQSENVDATMIATTEIYEELL